MRASRTDGLLARPDTAVAVGRPRHGDARSGWVFENVCGKTQRALYARVIHPSIHRQYGRFSREVPSVTRVSRTLVVPVLCVCGLFGSFDLSLATDPAGQTAAPAGETPAPPKDSKDKDAKESKEPRDSKESKDAKDSKDATDQKDQKELKEPKEPKKSESSKQDGAGDAPPAKPSKDERDASKDHKEVGKESKPARDQKDSKDSKDSREGKDGKSDAPAKKAKGEGKSDSKADAKSDAMKDAKDAKKDAPDKSSGDKPPVAEPEPAPKPDVSTKRPIGSIMLTVKLALLADPLLLPYDIEVEMDGEKAVLSGKVASEEEKKRAGEIAQGIEPIKGVVNKLDVAKDLAAAIIKRHDQSIVQAVKDRFARSETLKSVGFDVKSEQGLVSLSGKTRFQVFALEAVQAARQVPGVRAVDTSNIQLSGESKE